jgi:hypothetical protein
MRIRNAFDLFESLITSTQSSFDPTNIKHYGSFNHEPRLENYQKPVLPTSAFAQVVNALQDHPSQPSNNP